VHFEELAFYLQQRIDKTKLAKVKGNSHRNYQTFEDHQTHTLSPGMSI